MTVFHKQFWQILWFYLLFFSTHCCQIIGQNTAVFSDNFETAQTWTIFEEIVSGNACYGDNIGEVIRSTDIAQAGTNGLRVWSNKNASTKSNHVIAAHTISTTAGLTGRARYGLWAYNATPIGLTQSGPEMSVQSTRTVGSTNLTFIAGIQYIGNQWVGDKWNVWHNGTWETIKTSEFGATLAPNTWYYLELEFDMTTNAYISFKVQGGGLNENLNLNAAFMNAPTGFQIGGEARSWTPSLFVTAESENLWTNCSEVRENKMYYDNVSLESIIPLAIELIDFKGIAETKGNLLTWVFGEAKGLNAVEVQKSKEGVYFTSLISPNPKEGVTVDSDPFDLTYYRLLMTEINGKETLSKIIAVKRLGTEGGKIKVYPNPTTDVLVIDNVSGKEIDIVNTLGQVVLSQKYMLNATINIQSLQSGVYFVKTKGEAVRFIKQ